MGLWEFLDEIEEGAEDGLEAVGRGVGDVADKAAHAVGDGLDALGLHSAAEAVDGLGDSVADTLGAEVGEARLGQTDDPAKLVHGDAGALRAAAGHLAKFGAAFGKTADGLRRIDTAHWTGEAADKFRAQYRQHPAQWSDAAEACTSASAALTTFADAVQWAQQQASEAIRLFTAARRQSEQAQAAYNAAPQSGPFTDPGVAGARRAQQLLDDARARRNAEGDRAKAALEQATAKAPAEPRFTDRLLDEAGDLLQEGGDGVVHFYGGIVKGVGGILKFGRSLNPLDPYNMTHPAEYVAGLSGTAAGLLHTVNHPLDLLKGMLGDGWGSDPFEAMGKLVPNVALAVATDGAGAAGERVAAAGEEAAESAAVTAGREAAEVAAERPAGFVERPVEPPPPAEDFGPAGHDFGPAGHEVPAEPPPSFHEKPDIASRLDHIDEDGFDYSDPLGRHGDAPVGEHGGPIDGAAHPDDVPTSSHGDTPQDHGHAGDVADSTVHHDDAPASEHLPPPDYAGDPHFRTDEADYADFRENYANYDRHAEAIHDIVANHPEFAGIPESDLVGIRGYTTSDYFHAMNEGLRTGDQAVMDQYAAHARSAVSGLNQLPPHEGVVFRGVDFGSAAEAKQVADAYVPGTVYEEPAFFSTDVTKPFEGNVQFEVRSTNGRYIHDLSASNLTEEEVLFPPGTRFNVLDKFFDKDTKTWHIGLEDIP